MTEAHTGKGSFVCTQDWLDARCTQLNWRIGELFDLIAVFRVATEVVEQHNNDNGPALYEVERLLRSGLCGLQRIGDDLGDLAAFEAVRALREQGLATLLVTSESGEESALMALADVAVPGPSGVVEFLAKLSVEALRADF